MKKISRVISILFVAMSSLSFADNFYVGPTVFLQTITAKNSNYFGIHPAMSLGYAHISGKYYLSGEIFGSPVAGVIATSISHQGVNTKTTYSVGGSFIPGIVFDSGRTWFLRLGLINSHFPGPNESKTGLQAGLGVLSPLTPKWDLRAEYVLTRYQTMTGLGAPTSNELGLGVVYKFGNV